MLAQSVLPYYLKDWSILKRQCIFEPTMMVMMVMMIDNDNVDVQVYLPKSRVVSLLKDIEQTFQCSLLSDPIQPSFEDQLFNPSRIS